MISSIKKLPNWASYYSLFKKFLQKLSFIRKLFIWFPLFATKRKVKQLIILLVINTSI